MAKIELKGIVKRLTKVEMVGKDASTRKQSLILFVPGYRDEFGDQRGRDEEWCLDIFNDKIEQLALNTNLHEKKVVCKVYLNSNRWQTKDGNDAHIINANLAEIRIFDGYAPNDGAVKNEW